MTPRWTDADLEAAFKEGFKAGDYNNSGNIEREWDISDTSGNILQATIAAKKAEREGTQA